MIIFQSLSIMNDYMIRKINRDKWAITSIAGSIHLH